jgi:hypothetical protein
MFGELYECSECFRVFDTPGKAHEPREYWGQSCSETVSCCPYCGSYSFEDYTEEEEEEE